MWTWRVITTSVTSTKVTRSSRDHDGFKLIFSCHCVDAASPHSHHQKFISSYCASASHFTLSYCAPLNLFCSSSNQESREQSAKGGRIFRVVQHNSSANVNHTQVCNRLYFILYFRDHLQCSQSQTPDHQVSNPGPQHRGCPHYRLSHCRHPLRVVAK